MISLKTLFLAATGALAIPLTSPPAPDSEPEHTLTSMLTKRSTPSSQGTHSSFFYSFWTDGLGNVTYLNGANGSYTVSWQKCNNFYGGKGWNPGTENKNITYAASIASEGNTYLSVYGWTRNPLVEYYVVESYGTYNPASQYVKTKERMLESDGGVYSLGVTRQVMMAMGPAVLTKVWSVREGGDRRVAGTVNMKRHFEAWKEKLGVNFGTMDFQVVAVEGYQSSGEAEVRVEQST